MRADSIVLLEPFSDDDFGLFNGCKPFCVQDLSAQSSIEPLIVSILPGRPGCDEERFYANLCEPFLKVYRLELPAIVTAHMLRLSMFEDQSV